MGRPLVAGLFVSSCLLSIVSWYTTQQGMALYLSPWFSFMASLGVQSALVLVAWLIGLSTSKRALLIAVYAITAAISISFSYVSLYTWFSSRERPGGNWRAIKARPSRFAWGPSNQIRKNGRIRAIHVQDFPKFLIQGPNPTRDGELVSVANNGRISITDISDRDKPRVAASFESPFQAATLMDKRLYLGDARDLWIYSISKP
jgi:hypothetical protein